MAQYVLPSRDSLDVKGLLIDEIFLINYLILQSTNKSKVYGDKTNFVMFFAYIGITFNKNRTLHSIFHQDH